MDIAFAIGVPVAFMAGVVAHKYVMGEAAAIKAHVTAEIEEVRADLNSLLTKAASKV